MIARLQLPVRAFTFFMYIYITPNEPHFKGRAPNVRCVSCVATFDAQHVCSQCRATPTSHTPAKASSSPPFPPFPSPIPSQPPAGACGAGFFFFLSPNTSKKSPEKAVFPHRWAVPGHVPGHRRPWTCPWTSSIPRNQGSPNGGFFVMSVLSVGHMVVLKSPIITIRAGMSKIVCARYPEH